MSRFFFDVLHGRRVCEDPEGQDFIDLDAARAEAVVSAQYLVAHGILRNEDVSDRSFLIRDEDEQTVATVPFESMQTRGGWLPIEVGFGLMERGRAGAEAGMACEVGGGAGARRDHGDRGRVSPA